jgi:hypothetical protein
MKKQWRVVLNQYNDWCMANNVKNVTIPKDRYQKHIFLHSTYMGTFLHTGTIPYLNNSHCYFNPVYFFVRFAGLLRDMLANNVVNNAANIRAGFEACGIIPLNKDKVLARLPAEDEARRTVQNEFDDQLTQELKRNRYGDATKKTRAKKANRLPAGMSYTVSAITAEAETLQTSEEPQPGTVIMVFCQIIPGFLTSTDSYLTVPTSLFNMCCNFDICLQVPVPYTIQVFLKTTMY